MSVVLLETGAGLVALDGTPVEMLGEYARPASCAYPSVEAALEAAKVARLRTLRAARGTVAVPVYDVMQSGTLIGQIGLSGDYVPIGDS